MYVVTSASALYTSQAQANVLFKTSTSLFGTQANQISEAARVVYTVNEPLCGTDGRFCISRVNTIHYEMRHRPH